MAFTVFAVFMGITGVIVIFAMASLALAFGDLAKSQRERWEEIERRKRAGRGK